MDHVAVIIRFGPHAFFSQAAHVIAAFVAEGAELRRQDQRCRHICRQFAKEGRGIPAVVTGTETLVEIPGHLGRRKARPGIAVLLDRREGVGHIQAGIDQDLMSQRKGCIMLQGLARISRHAAAGAVTAQGQVRLVGDLQGIERRQGLPGYGQGIFIGRRIRIFRSQAIFRRNDDMLRCLGNAAADRVIDGDRVDGKTAAMIVDQDRQGPARIGNIDGTS